MALPLRISKNGGIQRPVVPHSYRNIAAATSTLRRNVEERFYPQGGKPGTCGDSCLSVSVSPRFCQMLIQVLESASDEKSSVAGKTHNVKDALLANMFALTLGE